MTPTYAEAVNISCFVKNNSTAKVVMGGHHISAVRDEVLYQSKHNDFVIIGEGEETLLELVKELEINSNNFKEIDELAWRDKNGNVHQNKAHEFIRDLDKFPFPARNLVDLDRYRVHSYIDFGRKSTTMITSRGYPHRCIFCSSHLTMGRKYRFRSAENVLAEVNEIVERYNIDHIVFEDGTITFMRDRMVKICEGLLRMKKDLTGTVFLE